MLASQLPLRTALRMLLRGQYHRGTRVGICAQLEAVVSPPDTDIFYRHIHTWPHRGVSRSYPIPSQWQGVSSFDFFYNAPKWKGNALMLRRSLIRHVLRELDKMES